MIGDWEEQIRQVERPSLFASTKVTQGRSGSAVVFVSRVLSLGTKSEAGGQTIGDHLGCGDAHFLRLRCMGTCLYEISHSLNIDENSYLISLG